MGNDTLILLQLILAHLVSDFILQNKKIVEGKRGNGKHYKSYYLISHGLIHSVLSYLFAGLWTNWIIPTVIFISHTIIDSIKTGIDDKRKKCKLSSFLIDQIFHLLVILTLWGLLFSDLSVIKTQFQIFINDRNFWIIAISYILILQPTSIFMKLIFRKLELINMDDPQIKGLKDAGLWIGYIERVLVLTFVLTENIECVGFLLAAKSVFRFGELNKSTEIKRTEYMLIGTLLSFAIAIFIGFIVLKKCSDYVGLCT